MSDDLLPDDVQLNALLNNARRTVDDLRRYMKRMEIGRALILVNQLGLTAGINALESDTFIKRLDDAKGQKRLIAHWFLEQPHIKEGLQAYKDGSNEDLTGGMFIESGSTLAYPIGGFAKSILALKQSREDGARYPIDILTNSFFGTTAFANLIRTIEPTPGALDLHYLGYFPFREPGKDDYGKEAATENVRYCETLKRQIGRCRHIYGALSDLSLVAGPTVGSFQNALFKRTMHAAFKSGGSQQLYLPIHFEKLAGLTGGNPCGERSRVPGNQCHPVFKRHPAIEEILRGLTDDSVPSSKWHKTWAKGELPETPIEALLRAADQFVPVNDMNDFRAPWFLAARGIRIIIALPSDHASSAMHWIRQEVKAVNAVLKMIPDNDVSYREPVEDKVHGVCELIIQ